MSRRNRPFAIGTRGSALALAQTSLVEAELRRHHPGLEISVVTITTRGDVLADRPLADLGRGVFVGEIEAALLSGAIDLAVHSAKDLPSELPQGLALAAFPRRADPRDVLVTPAAGLRALPPGARIGTSSPRRACQVRAIRPDVEPLDIRGNVDTRLGKLAGGAYDAIVLAAAGMQRLGREHEISEWLPLELMLPAVGQGALALEVRSDDRLAASSVAALNHPTTELAVRAERAFLACFGVGCSAAIAAHATIAGAEISLAGLIGHPDGRHVRGTRTGRDAAALARSLADELGARGGAALLAERAREAESAAW